MTATTDTASLTGKIAIVTGASRGIGKACALELAKRGVKGITITYQSNVEAANTTASELKARGSEVLVLKAPGTVDNAYADNLIQQTLQAFNVETIDILVNNAAFVGVRQMGSITPKDFHDFYDWNVLATYLLTQSILPVIAKGGSIINISSTAARVVGGSDPLIGGGLVLYSTSKAALEHLTRCLAASYAKEKRITMNVVAPGGTSTDGMMQMPEHLKRKIEEDATAETRMGTPEEVADVVAFLAGGGGARWINGETVHVNGGAAMF
ncbi:hypothetical protein AC578_7128 [Pseudocercospora eumusae]|uniref:Uncharacterized protein n=1 Tax=Pseudocercospora eumusae TaxID=321146 RepID=A0A139HWN8_9PEZI|nr:hypothetical protein AC578_7128 [Pseudocercospora eumusae]